ncbi:hypothetical protein SADUNF_Sadunf12G0109200 [Salix dunnii]|uniref:Uncharacterized protein n=1 Tax=Salix dunnii TaxID=1413687 RepID=A0A835MNH1_9ROSI|nr:hypothetical protein SADUNF_Sadunf12G0109200 [Salix dunnii]
MSGGDSTCVALLPAGFVILPDNSFSNVQRSQVISSLEVDHLLGRTPKEIAGELAMPALAEMINVGKVEIDEAELKQISISLFTNGFAEILASNLPSAKLTVETIHNLISYTVQRIKTTFN